MCRIVFEPYGFKGNGIFVILVSQDGFERKCPKQSLPKVTPEAVVYKCSSR